MLCPLQICRWNWRHGQKCLNKKLNNKTSKWAIGLNAVCACCRGSDCISNSHQLEFYRKKRCWKTSSVLISSGEGKLSSEDDSIVKQCSPQHEVEKCSAKETMQKKKRPTIKGTSVSRGQKRWQDIEQRSNWLWIEGGEKKIMLNVLKKLHHVCLIPFCIIDMILAKCFLNNWIIYYYLLPQRVPDLDKKFNLPPPYVILRIVLFYCFLFFFLGTVSRS